MGKRILMATPKLSSSGGVSSFWNALLPVFNSNVGLNVQTLQIGGHGKNLFGPLLDQWNFKKSINTQPDMAFLNPSLGSRSFFRDALFAKQLIGKNIPFIVFFHGWSLDFEKKVDAKYIRFFLKTFGQAKKIFVLSQDFKNKIVEWGYAGEVIVETTNVDATLINDFSIEKKMEEVQTSDSIKILFLARLLREKGVFETVEAFRDLCKKHENIELTIAGDGKDLQILKEFVKNDNNITIVGHVEGDSKIDLFNGSHIYCLPSYSEGLPTSVLEAMAFGMPVLTTKVGGLKAFFQDEKMGYFVQPKNIEELEEKLDLLINDRNKIIDMGRYNHNFATDNLLNTVVAKRLVSHMESVINDTKALNG